MALISINKIKKLFESGNIAVCGLRGTGKDVLIGNVVARRKSYYISNMDYTHDDRYIPLDFNLLDVGGNTYRNFISGDIKRYKYPYPQGADIYISDVGVYLPSQYTGQLDRDYPHIPTFLALSRQIANCNVHTNSQAFERQWNKVREQTAQNYILCKRCKVLFGKVVIANFTLYDRAESFEKQVPVFDYRLPLMANKQMKQNAELQRANYQICYGTVKNYTYICLNKSKHDDRYFRRLLNGGVDYEEIPNLV